MNHFQDFLHGLSLYTSAFHHQITEIIGQGATSGEPRRQRYASLSCYTYWLVSKHWSTMGNSRLTASIHMLDNDSLLHVFYLCRPFLLGEDDDDDGDRLIGARQAMGSADTGGINLRMFAEDGETSYSGQQPILVFPLSVHTAAPVADMLLIHLPFHSSSITSYEDLDIATEDEERMQSLLSDSVIAFFSSPYHACYESTESHHVPSWMSIQFWSIMVIVLSG
jgi:hypothetical protein